MKLICSYSGLTVTVSNIPLSLPIVDSIKLSYIHPIFSLPTKKLFPLIPRYINNTLGTTEDSKLLFLALLNSCNLLEFRAPALALSSEIVDKYLLQVADAIIKINALHCTESLSSLFPRLVVTSETSLSNINCYLKELLAITSQEHLRKAVTNRRAVSNNLSSQEHESIFTRALNKNRGNLKAFSARLAEWAEYAANFPITIITVDSESTTIADYWKALITKCGTEDYINIPRGDLVDIIDHLSEHIEVGTVFSNNLFKLLENTIDKLDNFLGINLDAPFFILTGNSEEPTNKASSMHTSSSNPVNNDKEVEHIKAIIASAPDKEPSIKDYPSKIAYMRAKAAWNTAQKYASQLTSIPEYNL